MVTLKEGAIQLHHTSLVLWKTLTFPLRFHRCWPFPPHHSRAKLLLMDIQGRARASFPLGMRGTRPPHFYQSLFVRLRFFFSLREHRFVHVQPWQSKWEKIYTELPSIITMYHKQWTLQVAVTGVVRAVHLNAGPEDEIRVSKWYILFRIKGQVHSYDISDQFLVSIKRTENSVARLEIYIACLFFCPDFHPTNSPKEQVRCVLESKYI